MKQKTCSGFLREKVCRVGGYRVQYSVNLLLPPGKEEEGEPPSSFIIVLLDLFPVAKRRQRTRCALVGFVGSVHEPDVGETSGFVAPQDVKVAVSVEVTEFLDVPVLVGKGREIYPGFAGTVHCPYEVLAVDDVSP